MITTSTSWLCCYSTLVCRCTHMNVQYYYYGKSQWKWNWLALILPRLCPASLHLISCFVTSSFVSCYDINRQTKSQKKCTWVTKDNKEIKKVNVENAYFGQWIEPIGAKGCSECFGGAIRSLWINKMRWSIISTLNALSFMCWNCLEISLKATNGLKRCQRRE